MKKEKLIELILKYGIIGTNFRQPITFKSGIKSPIYCNFRKSIEHPEDLLGIIVRLISEKINALEADCVAGVATGALPYSSICGMELMLPACYIRPDSKVKEYGLKQQIEGCSVSGKKVTLIEDLVSTAGSIVNNAEILRKHGAEKVFLLSIFSYEMELSKKELAESGFELDPLITIHDILPFLKETLSVSEYVSLEDWVSDPVGWFDRHKTEFEFGFLTQLRQSAKDAGSIICMGHDPVIESLPEEYPQDIDGMSDFLIDLYAEMQSAGVSPAMFKPNLPWWLRYDQPRRGQYHGSDSLAMVMNNMGKFFPGIPINIDCKSGDIGTSSSRWATYIFEQWMADAMTVHTYMGSDSVGPFISYCNNNHKKGAYLLVKTTNKGAADLELQKLADGRFVYELVGDKVIEWAKDKPGVGVVIAGNSPEELAVLLKKLAGRNIATLHPGVGPSQGGDAREVTQIIRATGFEIELARINLSSGSTHPWYKEGRPNPKASECFSMIIETFKSLNEQVGFMR